MSYSNSTKMVYQPERRVSGGEFPHTLFSTLQSASTRSRLGQGVQGEHFWGVAGAELEGYVNHLLRIGSGGRVLLCSVKKNNLGYFSESELVSMLGNCGCTLAVLQGGRAEGRGGPGGESSP